jgi:hypothetical protein
MLYQKIKERVKRERMVEKASAGGMQAVLWQ